MKMHLPSLDLRAYDRAVRCGSDPRTRSQKRLCPLKIQRSASVYSDYGAFESTSLVLEANLSHFTPHAPVFKRDRRGASPPRSRGGPVEARSRSTAHASRSQGRGCSDDGCSSRIPSRSFFWASVRSRQRPRSLLGAGRKASRPPDL